MTGFLERVSKGRKIDPPRIVIYGGPGAGKTTFAASAPNAVVIPVEDGLGKLDVSATPRPETFDDLIAILRELATEKHEYKTVVIDAIDKVEPLIWAHTCKPAKKTNIEDFGYGKGYKLADTHWIKLFEALDYLRSERGMVVIVVAHAHSKMIDDVFIGAHLAISPKLHDRATALLEEWSDILGHLARERFAAAVGPSDERETDTATDTGKRVLYLDSTGGAKAKNRYDLPTRIEVPQDAPYGAFRAALASAIAQDPTPKPATVKADTDEEAA